MQKLFVQKIYKHFLRITILATIDEIPVRSYWRGSFWSRYVWRMVCFYGQPFHWISCHRISSANQHIFWFLFITRTTNDLFLSLLCGHKSVTMNCQNEQAQDAQIQNSKSSDQDVFFWSANVIFNNLSSKYDLSCLDCFQYCNRWKTSPLLCLEAANLA